MLKSQLGTTTGKLVWGITRGIARTARHYSEMGEAKKLIEHKRANNDANDAPLAMAVPVSDTRGKHLATMAQLHRETLAEYFLSSHFTFPPDRYHNSIKVLRNAMDKVYVRERPMVSIDIEAWERSNKKITEIGIAIYRPEELVNSIFPSIELIHLVVDEHIRMNNGRFVPDNKANALCGVSYRMPLYQCTRFVQDLVARYLEHSLGVLIGHNIKGDLEWLRSMGVNFPEAMDIVDTATVHRVTRTSGGSLRGLLRLVAIPHGYLHNAANDAYYTLVAALAYCDPKIRIKYELDTYREVEPVPGGSKKRDKFSDRATVVSYSDGGVLFTDLFQ